MTRKQTQKQTWKQATLSRRGLLKAGLLLATGLMLPARALATESARTLATEPVSAHATGPVSARTTESTPAPTAEPEVRLAMLIRMHALSAPGLLERVIQACHTAHNVPDIPKPALGEPDRRVEWIRAELFGRVFSEQDVRFTPDSVRRLIVPALCNHCDNPPCVRVCPTGATFKEPDGRVGMDQHRCIGCRYCMAACPYGARSFNFCDPRPFIADPVPSYPARTRGVVEKCTFCPERLAVGREPWCVEAAQGAIVFGNLHDPQSAVRRLLARYPSLERKPALGTGPAVYYILE